MKNMAKAERPKSAMAILPVRPCRASGKAAQVAFSPESRDGNSSIPTVNHFLGDLRIPKMHVLQNLFQESSVEYTTFRIAAGSATRLLFHPSICYCCWYGCCFYPC